MAWLGMPLDSRWCAVKMVRPIAADGSSEWVLAWRDRPDTVSVRPSFRSEGHTSAIGGLAEWAGYRAEGFGTLADDETPAIPSGLIWQFEPENELLTVQLWECKVFTPAGRLYALAEWRPGYSNTNALYGDMFLGPGPPTQRDQQQAWHAQELLWQIGGQQRPGGRQKLQDESDPTTIELFKTIVAFRRAYPGYTWKQATAHHEVSYNTFKRWRRVWGHLIEQNDPK
jgi:hypothetical protein